MTTQEMYALADLARKYRGSVSSEFIELLANYCQRFKPNFDHQRWLDYIHRPAEEEKGSK